MYPQQVRTLELENDPGLSGHIRNLAATYGHIGALKWMHAENHMLSPASASVCAAGGGHLNVLEWLAAEGLFKDCYVCMAAASGGHLNVLEWAYQRGCVWDNSTLKFVVLNRHTELCEWAERHGCPPYEPMTYHFNSTDN